MCLQCLPSKKSCFCQDGSWRRMTGPDTKYRKEAHDFSVSLVAFKDEAHSVHSQRIALRLWGWVFFSACTPSSLFTTICLRLISPLVRALLVVGACRNLAKCLPCMKSMGNLRFFGSTVTWGRLQRPRIARHFTPQGALVALSEIRKWNVVTSHNHLMTLFLCGCGSHRLSLRLLNLFRCKLNNSKWMAC